MSSAQLEPPPKAVYASLEELMSAANEWAKTRGYKLVIVRSKTNTQGQKTWVQLACDRHGQKRNTHGLTEETRKKNRRSRRCECPMYCVASKRGQGLRELSSNNGGLWELNTRVGEHNHGPYEPPQKKRKDIPPPPPSEAVNLPLLQTPGACIADFCLIPIGSGNPSVSAEIAEVQRLLNRSGLHITMHSAGTTVEGSWDDVMRIIGQAHSLLHSSGVVRIQNDIRIGTRTDKKQTAQDKIDSVHAHLNREVASAAATAAEAGQVENGHHVDDEHDMTDPAIQQMSQAMAPIQNAIAPNLDHVVPSLRSNVGGHHPHHPPPMPPPMHHPPPHHHHPMSQHLHPNHLGPPTMTMQ